MMDILDIYVYDDNIYYVNMFLGNVTKKSFYNIKTAI